MPKNTLEVRWNAKLTPEAVRAIRKSKKTQTELAKKHQVSQTTISNILRGKVYTTIK